MMEAEVKSDAGVRQRQTAKGSSDHQPSSSRKRMPTRCFESPLLLPRRVTQRLHAARQTVPLLLQQALVSFRAPRIGRALNLCIS